MINAQRTKSPTLEFTFDNDEEREKFLKALDLMAAYTHVEEIGEIFKKAFKTVIKGETW